MLGQLQFDKGQLKKACRVKGSWGKVLQMLFSRPKHCALHPIGFLRRSSEGTSGAQFWGFRKLKDYKMTAVKGSLGLEGDAKSLGADKGEALAEILDQNASGSSSGSSGVGCQALANGKDVTMSMLRALQSGPQQHYGGKIVSATVRQDVKSSHSIYSKVNEAEVRLRHLSLFQVTDSNQPLNDVSLKDFA